MDLTNEQLDWIVGESIKINDKIDLLWIMNFADGVHSEIPVCCVIFFCHTWMHLNHWDQRLIFDMQPSPIGVNYVRCPECCKNNRRVEIHYCQRTKSRRYSKKCFYKPAIKYLASTYPEIKKQLKKEKKEKGLSCNY